jgi:hypothetical protein
MPVALAVWMLGTAAAYLGLGGIFAVVFLTRGVQKIDPAAALPSVGFRVIIVPGVVAFWPLLLRRWLTGATHPPEERNAHRHAVRSAGRRR